MRRFGTAVPWWSMQSTPGERRQAVGSRVSASGMMRLASARAPLEREAQPRLSGYCHLALRAGRRTAPENPRLSEAFGWRPVPDSTPRPLPYHVGRRNVVSCPALANCLLIGNFSQIRALVDLLGFGGVRLPFGCHFWPSPGGQRVSLRPRKKWPAEAGHWTRYCVQSMSQSLN